MPYLHPAMFQASFALGPFVRLAGGGALLQHRQPPFLVSLLHGPAFTSVSRKQDCEGMVDPSLHLQRQIFALASTCWGAISNFCRSPRCWICFSSPSKMLSPLLQGESPNILFINFWSVRFRSSGVVQSSVSGLDKAQWGLAMGSCCLLPGPPRTTLL